MQWELRSAGIALGLPLCFVEHGVPWPWSVPLQSLVRASGRHCVGGCSHYWYVLLVHSEVLKLNQFPNIEALMNKLPGVSASTVKSNLKAWRHACP